MNWQEFCDHLEALKNGEGAKRLAAEQKRLEGMIESARKAKIELSEIKAQKVKIQEQTEKLAEREGLLERAEQELSDRSTLMDAREAAVERKNQSLEASFTDRFRDLEKKEKSVEALRQGLARDNSIVQEKMDHLKAAGVM